MSGAKFDEMTPWPVAAVPRYDYAVLRPSASLDLGALTRFLEEKRIARFKLPERLEVIESLPATAVGKIWKKDLRDDIQRKLSRERGV